MSGFLFCPLLARPTGVVSVHDAERASLGAYQFYVDASPIGCRHTRRQTFCFRSRVPTFERPSGQPARPYHLDAGVDVWQ